MHKENFNPLHYDHKHRWMSYWYQIQDVVKFNPATVLEVGVGNRFVSDYLKKIGLQVTSLDIDPVKQPDVVGNVLGLPLADNSFDVVLCSEVLEHLPFENFTQALRELYRVSKRGVVLSLPHWGWTFYAVLKTPLLGERKLFGKLSGLKSHDFDGEHFWEIGKQGYSARRIRRVLKKTGGNLVDEHISPDSPFHHFFVLEKSSDKPKIFITSYTYTYERHHRVFDFFKSKDNIVFILPRVWKAKGGKIIVNPPEKKEFKLLKTWAPFYHSRYPIIRGLLKGWLPFAGSILRRIARPGDVLFSSGEPNLLTTYLQGLLAKKLGLKHVILTWQNIPYQKRLNGFKLKLTEWLIKKNIALSDGILCGTFQAREILQPYLNKTHVPTAVIPQSGVDTDLFKPEIASDFRKKYNLEDKIIYLFGAVFDERKGTMTTVRAFGETLKKIPNAHLVMIGMGKLESQVKALVSELGLNEHATFIEWLPNHELAGIFNAVDILVHPSEPYKDWEEQYGWTILQASAAGLPIIATTIGALGEAVIQGKTGILVEPKNVAVLASAMVQLAQNPNLRKEMGKAGQAYILERFSHKNVAERLENFFYSL